MPGSTVRLLRAIADEEQTDAELLGRFADRRDEAAFALLVRRHGAMVYGVCRRILPTEQDAEDAFQATFLVLVQKARAAPREAVGNWLYGVARRVALMARRTIVARREREMGEYPASEQADDLRAALDEELSRLPDVYRTVIVLCDLEERTRREAAAVLGWPEGTVAGRLVRAREMLAKRLARHAPAVSVAAALAGAASARVPEVHATSAPIPPAVAALTREVLGAMTRGKLMKAATVALLLGCAGFGMVFAQKPTTKETPVVPAATEVPMKPPTAGGVAWGKEVDGLQIGLAGGAPAYRHGEKARLEVRLRNVGKAEVRITHGLLREYPPKVTATDGARMTVVMPLPLGIKVRLEERVIKPGETITLYNPEVAMESEGMLRPEGVIRAATPTTYLAPGKYRIGYGGMIRSHPKLATGTVEFEVKDAKPKPFTAWGKEVGGLQAGLEVKEKRPYRMGETIALAVRVRNVGKQAVKFEYVRQYLDENPPAVTGADGRPIPQGKSGVTGVAHVPVEVGLEPGQEVALASRIQGASGLRYELRPAGGKAAAQGPSLDVGTGKVAIQFEKVFGNSSIGRIKIDPDLAGLATGKLEIEVTAPEVRLFEPEPDVQEVSDSLPLLVGPLQKDGARNIKARKDVVGKPVRVEGIAWGQPFGLRGQRGTVSPHAGPHVVYEGGSVFVRGVDFTEAKARGKPVRVTGTLRFEPKSGTRWGDVKGFYYIEAAGFEAIDAVTDPYLVYLEK